MIDSDVYFIETRVNGIKEELKMIESALNRLKNRMDAKQ